MDITPLTAKGRQVISHYGNGGFTVNGTAHRSSILILGDRLMPWPVASAEEITVESFTPLMADGAPEILLVGMGAGFKPLPVHLKDYLKAHGITADAMDTGAACRTYSVLLAEDRLVAAALIAI